MTDGEIVYEAPDPDCCYPRCRPPAAWASGDGMVVTYHYPGTVWKCGCGRVWVVGDGNEWEPEGWRQRRRRRRRERRAERQQATAGGYPSSGRDVTDLAAPVGRARSVIVGRTPDAVSVPKNEIVPSAAVGRGPIVFGPPPSGVAVCPPVSAPKDQLPPSAAVDPEEDGTDG